MGKISELLRFSKTSYPTLMPNECFSFVSMQLFINFMRVHIDSLDRCSSLMNFCMFPYSADYIITESVSSTSTTYRL